MQDIVKIARRVVEGAVIAFPTEGVYGIGASILHTDSINNIFSIKNRSKKKLLSLHVSNIKEALKFGIFSDIALKIAQSFFPGGIGIIVPISTYAKSFECFKDYSTICIRIPDNYYTLTLLNYLNNPLVGTSANESGGISITNIDLMESTLREKVLIMKEKHEKIGSINLGIESTIISCIALHDIQILRSGPISAKDIFYRTKIMLNQQTSFIRKDSFFIVNADKRDNRVVNISLDFNSQNYYLKKLSDLYIDLSEKGCIMQAAKNFYSNLHYIRNFLQDKKVSKVNMNIANIPCSGIGVAIYEKLSNIHNLLQY